MTQERLMLSLCCHISTQSLGNSAPQWAVHRDQSVSRFGVSASFFKLPVDYICISRTMQLGPGFRAQARTVITLSLFQLSLYSFSSWRRLLLFNGLDPLRNFNAGLWGYNLSWDTGYCRLSPSSGRRAMRTTALEKGFLYAAAAPLSILGSLGIVRVAFATLLATITHPFCGGNWLDDAGFSTPGSVSSMVTITKGTQKYGAELQLQRLLEDQHINDPNLVSASSGLDGLDRERTSVLMGQNLPIPPPLLSLVHTAIEELATAEVPFERRDRIGRDPMRGKDTDFFID
ncbi:hypothetical protein L218DRAFT_992156 [Marasmius fiardii PR-910]|nr:hypothetical protein L218DRAFT_992156 [Marasmius fiardii PR-910]